MRVFLLLAAALTLAACDSIFDSGYDSSEHEETVATETHEAETD